MEHRQWAVAPPGIKIARAIVRTLRSARRAGQRLEAIILSPEHYRQLQDPMLSYLWCDATRDALFDIPVEVDADVEVWAVRVK